MRPAQREHYYGPVYNECSCADALIPRRITVVINSVAYSVAWANCLETIVESLALPIELTVQRPICEATFCVRLSLAQTNGI
jgi:hypothetical protein